MDSENFKLVEYDEAGNLTRTYIHTYTGSDSSRVDIIVPEDAKTPVQQLLDVFLPAGYPHSVTPDYINYQIYDSLQAFSSSIAGLLSSRAVLEGVGVGDPTSTPTSALLLSIIQETFSRFATILFAHRLGTAIEPECKRYRLAADVFNDAAMILDCISPSFPKSIRVGVLVGAGVLRALCGVAAGGAKASLSAHFAVGGNLGELNAKDSSQETVISLLGMLAGSLVVSRITSQFATWVTLLVLLAVHLGTNYMAVKAVVMRSLNRQRANIVLNGLLFDDPPRCLTPEEVSKVERMFEHDGILRDTGGNPIGWAHFVDTESFLQSLGTSNAGTSSITLHDNTLLEWLFKLYSDTKYILWFDRATSTAFIVLKKGCKPTDQLQAWCQALIQCRVNQLDVKKRTDKFSELQKALGKAGEVVEGREGELRKVGWDLEMGHLETRSGMRVALSKDGVRGKGLRQQGK